MRIAVSSNGPSLDDQASPVFGRCPFYVFVETESMDFEARENPAQAASGGAGIQAAQFVIQQGAEALVTGNVGPNAWNVLEAAGLTVYLFDGGTVRQAAERVQQGQLQPAGGASAPEKAGMGRRGGGRGTGRMAAASPPSGSSSPATAPGSRQEEIETLKNMAVELRGKLAEVTERLDRLERGG